MKRIAAKLPAAWSESLNFADLGGPPPWGTNWKWHTCPSSPYGGQLHSSESCAKALACSMQRHLPKDSAEPSYAPDSIAMQVNMHFRSQFHLLAPSQAAKMSHLWLCAWLDMMSGAKLCRACWQVKALYQHMSLAPTMLEMQATAASFTLKSFEVLTEFNYDRLSDFFLDK